jgi:hypothetical protein
MYTPIIGGALLGIGWMHLVRYHGATSKYLSALFRGDPPERQKIALAGFVLYTLAGLLCSLPWFVPQAFGLGIAVVGPLIGVTAVLATGHRIDHYQGAVGVFQFVTLLAAVTQIVIWVGFGLPG